MRHKLIQSEKHRRTQELLELGVEESNIENAYSIILRYMDDLQNATQEHLSRIHEQEIVHRIITIGEK